MARVSKHPAVRRDELMDAALQLCVDIGYEAMSIEQVTQATGVATGTFYYHFASKTDLLIAMVGRWADELFDALEQADQTDQGTGAQRFQARDFRFDVVGLDVQMHAGLVLHLLHFDVQAARAGFELVVETEAAVIRVRDLQSERGAPER